MLDNCYKNEGPDVCYLKLPTQLDVLNNGDLIE